MFQEWLCAEWLLVCGFCWCSLDLWDGAFFYSQVIASLHKPRNITRETSWLRICAKLREGSTLRNHDQKFNQWSCSQTCGCWDGEGRQMQECSPCPHFLTLQSSISVHHPHWSTNASRSGAFHISVPVQSLSHDRSSVNFCRNETTSWS